MTDLYWGKIPEGELKRGLELIETKGWRAFEESFRGKLDFTNEENRADWRFMVPLGKDSVVLDLGAGLGRITVPLSRVVKKVIACDASAVRTRFLSRLAEAKGLTNIETQAVDLFDATFPEGSFDLIVMNGLLEWVGKTTKFSRPREAQVEALRRAKGWLKPGGILYVGIENRFALAYLRGFDHSGLRFTSYMPRFLANLWTRLLTGSRYDTYTYTKAGYSKLLREAGFASPEFYLVYPGYNLPRILIPYARLDLLQYMLMGLAPRTSTRRKLASFLARSGLLVWVYRHFFFSYSIFARK